MLWDTTVAQLLSHLHTVGSVTVWENGTATLSAATVKTGMTLTVSGIADSWTLVVAGDLNGDGDVNTTDARLVLVYTLQGSSTDGAMQLAADFNQNGAVNTGDVRDMLRDTLH